MFCSNCGQQIPDNSAFCPNCGARVNNGFNAQSVASAVESVESNLNQVAAGVEAGVGNAFNNLENDLNSAAREVANDLGFKSGDYSAPQQGEVVNTYNAPQQNPYGAQNQYGNPNQYSAPNYGAPNYGAPNYGNMPPVNNGGYYQGNTNPPIYSGTALKTDRSLLVYILLTIVTCGIYAWYFIYKLAKDVNTCCDGDGENTSGLLMFLLLSIVTCGIYSYIWFYKLGNRLHKNAPRYGMMFTENGTSVLMWQLFGVLLCGIGPFIAMNIIIKNTNMLCAAYNNYNASMGGQY